MNDLILAAARTEPPTTTAEAGYVIGSEDLVSVEVFGAETFSGAFRVEPSGAIAVPLLGVVQAAGHTARELEDSLEARLRATYMRDPHVTVRVDEMRSHGVSVLGAVRRPGVYQVVGPRTLLEVLAMAEGLDESAGNTVILIRKSPSASGSAEPAADDSTAAADHIREIDLGRLLWSESTEGNVEVWPGDIVQVRPAAFVYVVGEVNRPGGFAMPPGEPMTVLQALAMAGGLGDTAAAGRSVIVRQQLDGSREEIRVDLEDVLRGRTSPPGLGPRDVLFVPNNATKSFAIGVVNALVRMVTFRGLVY